MALACSLQSVCSGRATSIASATCSGHPPYHLGARRSIGVVDAAQRPLPVVFGRCRAVRLLHFAAARLRVPLTFNRQRHSPTGNIRYRTYSAMHDGTTPPLRRHHHRRQGRWRPPEPGRVRRGRRAGGISQGHQHRERAHGQPDRQHRHRRGHIPACGRLRRAKASGCVIDPLIGPL
jgi:hypothetical protein